MVNWSCCEFDQELSLAFSEVLPIVFRLLLVKQALELLLGTPNVFSIDQRTTVILSHKLRKEGASPEDIQRALVRKFKVDGASFNPSLPHVLIDSTLVPRCHITGELLIRVELIT
jgi:hypothetical protein